jgi:4a-hydroxytetrahydrobiopterin dehydratase
MSAALSLPAGWKPVERPPALFRRFEFDSYDGTREFLDRLAKLSEQTGLYPDLGFGKTHVNVTVHGSGGNLPGAVEIEFASAAAGLAGAETR